MKPRIVYESDRAVLWRGDCLEVLPLLRDSSVDLLATDPPYFKIKDEAWDRQWDKPPAFLRWLKRLRDEWHRALKPNGSLYCFTSPRMACKVESLIAGRFNILNHVVWAKHDGYGNGMHSRQHKEDCRSWFPQTERIIFAEHYGADNIAKGEAGYVAKCDELRGFVFEPLRKYLRSEWERAGLHTDQANDACGTASMAARHYFTRSQWCLPTAEHYASLQRYANAACNGSGHKYLRRDYEDLRRYYEDLRRYYEDLRRDYEDLRRPFAVSANVPYTDVWSFPTVPHRSGKHPCEKPVAMLRHIVAASSRPVAVVLDCFMGSGTTGVACIQTGRRFIGIERDPGYCKIAVKRLKAAEKAALAEIAA